MRKRSRSLIAGLTPEATGTRRRKLRGSRRRRRMVGSGSGERIGEEMLLDRAMDTGSEDIDADSEDEENPNRYGSTGRLMGSSSPRIIVHGSNNNSTNYNKSAKLNNRVETDDVDNDDDDDDVDDVDEDDEDDEDDENVWMISVQMFIPFLLAGFGMVAASLLLDVVQHWPVYRVVSEVYILVPALLGLKGNLEMTLASRLSTQANLGRMDTRKQQWTLVIGNLALIQCQAMVVGLLASLAAVVLGWVPEAHFDIHHGLLLCASSLVTASVASFLLGIIMVAVILVSRRINVNPDNVATPIAASLGDLTTLALLSWIASLLYNAIEVEPWIAPSLVVFCILATPIWGYIAARNPFTKEVLDHGWSPVVSAMLVSSIGGLILDYTIDSYKGIAVFQLVINGVGGNLVAVQASRISTSLHRNRSNGNDDELKMCVSPFNAFLAPGGHARTARILLMMVIPGHLIFSYTISYLRAGHTSFTATFILVYLFAAVLQVILLLYIARLMVVWMWTRGMDPDSSAIPYLTAAGDLLGTALLGIAFHVLYAIGDGDSDVGD